MCRIEGTPAKRRGRSDEENRKIQNRCWFNFDAPTCTCISCVACLATARACVITMGNVAGYKRSGTVLEHRSKAAGLPTYGQSVPCYNVRHMEVERKCLLSSSVSYHPVTYLWLAVSISAT